MLQKYLLTSKPTIEKDEEEIVSSFYEERRSRNSNQKYHNLLKKNISFFHPQHFAGEDEQNSKEAGIAQPPLPRQSQLQLTEEPVRRTVRSKSLANAEPRASFDSTPILEQKEGECSEQQLNKRININHYLSNLEDKENDSASSLNLNDANLLSTKTLKCSQKYLKYENDNHLRESSFQD
jgi:hypothetical protein